MAGLQRGILPVVGEAEELAAVRRQDLGGIELWLRRSLGLDQKRVGLGPRDPGTAGVRANQNERFAATLTLASRDGLSGFRTCLRAPVGSTEVAG